MFRKRRDRQIKTLEQVMVYSFLLSFVFFGVVHSFASTQVFLEWNPNSEYVEKIDFQ